MKALVLCGGKGTRLRPLTYTIPKQLVPIANRPILGYVFDHLQNAGITDIGVIISPETGDAIKGYLGTGENWHVRLTYILQPQPLGIAHAVKTARDFLGAEPFVVYLGDNLLQDGLTDALTTFVSQNADALVLLKKVPDPRQFGVVVLKDNKVISLVEKPAQPPSDLALVGVYVFSPKIHPVIERLSYSARGELEITDALQKLIEEKSPVIPKIITGWWLDTGKKDDLLNANQAVLETYCQHLLEGEIKESKVIGAVTVRPGAKIIDSRLIGPVAIGENAVIEDATIGPCVSIEPHCAISSSVIKHSVIMEKSRIINVNFLEKSLIGREVVVKSKLMQIHPFRLLLSDSSEVEL